MPSACRSPAPAVSLLLCHPTLKNWGKSNVGFDRLCSQPNYHNMDYQCSYISKIMLIVLLVFINLLILAKKIEIVFLLFSLNLVRTLQQLLQTRKWQTRVPHCMHSLWRTPSWVTELVMRMR